MTDWQMDMMYMTTLQRMLLLISISSDSRKFKETEFILLKGQLKKLLPKIEPLIWGKHNGSSWKVPEIQPLKAANQLNLPQAILWERIFDPIISHFFRWIPPATRVEVKLNCYISGQTPENLLFHYFASCFVSAKGTVTDTINREDINVKGPHKTRVVNKMSTKRDEGGEMGRLMWFSLSVWCSGGGGGGLLWRNTWPLMELWSFPYPPPPTANKLGFRCNSESCEITPSPILNKTWLQVELWKLSHSPKPMIDIWCPLGTICVDYTAYRETTVSLQLFHVHVRGCSWWPNNFSQLT